VFTEHGLHTLLAALESQCKGFSARFVAGGQVLNRTYPIDPGYPRTDDPDTANMGRGPNVLTWRVVVPPGTGWGSTPATAVALLDAAGGIIYKTNLTEPFFTSEKHPSVISINVIIRKLT